MAVISVNQNPFSYLEAEAVPVNNTMSFAIPNKPAHHRLRIQIMVVTGSVGIALNGTAASVEKIPVTGDITFEITTADVVNFITATQNDVFLIGVTYVQ